MPLLATVAAVILAWLVLLFPSLNAQNEFCYICGGDPTATIAYPSARIYEIAGFQGNGTCQQLFQAGVTALITGETCALILSDPSYQATCGCSNLNGSPTAPFAPALSPAISAPAYAPLAYTVDTKSSATTSSDSSFSMLWLVSLTAMSIWLVG
jgi:hypothetical protein